RRRPAGRPQDRADARQDARRGEGRAGRRPGHHQARRQGAMTRGKVALRSGAPRAAQRGFAIMVIVALIVLVSAYFLANGLNRTSAQISNDREARTMAALLKAKSALIAYAASEAWQSHMGQSTGQPGSLPCPDRDSDGDSDCVWAGITNSVSLIGLLPYTTL